MKHLSRAIIAVILAVLMATLFPAQVFADTPDYISEVKVFVGSYSDAEAEGFTILKDGNKAVDLNQDAGATGIGAKGNEAVYLGYKTTQNKKDAITDLALMNMKGGYSVQEYEALMEMQMKEQIIPFVDNFLTAINEYRENYNSEITANQQRAQYIHDELNKLTDDDCGGAGLGDLLLNETKYEMGEEAYNALSDEEKKQHADILTIIAQASGYATLLMNNLVIKASDTAEDNWVERFVSITYDDLVESTGLSPREANKKLAKLYDDKAAQILEMWDDFNEFLTNADQAAEEIQDVELTDIDEVGEKIDALDEDSKSNEVLDALTATYDMETEVLDTSEKVAQVAVSDYLSAIEYEDGTLLDFFMQSREEIEEDITVLFPLVASLSEGQKAGLEFLSLKELVVLSDKESEYSDEAINAMQETSIYEGVDRGIYEKGGVALTSDALRANAASVMAEDSGVNLFNPLMIALIGTTAAATVGFAASLIVKSGISSKIALPQTALNNLNTQITNMSIANNKLYSNLAKELGSFQAAGSNAEYQAATEKLSELSRQQYLKSRELAKLTSKSSTCSKLAVGLGVAIIVLTAVTLYLSYREMANYYNVDFTPIPHYIVDEKDLIGYNAKGEKIVLKNQTAYYKVVETNRTGGDYYDVVGNCNDLNGYVGKQWLALYAAKNEAETPILASSLKVVTKSEEIPAGYTKGIHSFGTDAPENLNNPLYVWNNSAPKVYVYYKTDDAAAVTGSNFTSGTLVLAGGAGLLFGVAVTALAAKVTKKKNDNNTVTV